MKFNTTNVSSDSCQKESTITLVIKTVMGVT